MDGHRQLDAMSDAALEREVESLLAVEPSTDFLARVRNRVASEAPPSGWRFRWDFAAAATVVVIVAGMVVWPSVEPDRSRGEARSIPPTTQESASVAARSADAPVQQAMPATELARSVAAVGARSAVQVAPKRGPVAVVAPEDGRAFERLLSSIREPDVVLVFSADPAAPTALSASNIEIAPITIEPVPPVAQLEGGVE